MQCVQISGGRLYLGAVVTDPSQCPATDYVWMMPSELPAASIWQPLSINDGLQIAAPILLMWALAFVFRYLGRDFFSKSEKE